MQIEPVVSAGNILSLIITLFAIIGAAWKIVSRISVLEMKLGMVWDWFVKEHKLNGHGRKREND